MPWWSREGPELWLLRLPRPVSLRLLLDLSTSLTWSVSVQKPDGTERTGRGIQRFWYGEEGAPGRQCLTPSPHPRGETESALSSSPTQCSTCCQPLRDCHTLNICVPPELQMPLMLNSYLWCHDTRGLGLWEAIRS